MRLLLDTNALIWVFSEPKRLAAQAAEVIADESSEIRVSVVSAWEIGVKRAKGKLRLPDNIEEMIAAKRFETLPVTMSHALAVEFLPAHHHDPFDRILVAQAQVEDLTLITSDRLLQRYPIATLPAI